MTKHKPPTSRQALEHKGIFLPISGTCTASFLCGFEGLLVFFFYGLRYDRTDAEVILGLEWIYPDLMELQFPGVLPPNNGLTAATQGPPLNNHHLITPPGPRASASSDIRNSARLPRPVSGYDFSDRNSEPCDMEKGPPMSTGKRRGGSRKACNECKQQKVCMILTGNFSSWVIEFATASM